MSLIDRMPAAESRAARYRYRFASREGCWLTGLVTTGPFSDAHERVTACWDEIAARYRELGLDEEPVEWLSPCHGRETEFTCYLGLISPEPVASIPEAMVTIELRPHDYAVASFKGTQEQLIEVYHDLDTWIVKQGRERNYQSLWLESYPRPYERSQDDLELEIWLPLREQG